jgi:hypothetical protein
MRPIGAVLPPRARAWIERRVETGRAGGRRGWNAWPPESSATSMAGVVLVPSSRYDEVGSRTDSHGGGSRSAVATVQARRRSTSSDTGDADLVATEINLPLVTQFAEDYTFASV